MTGNKKDYIEYRIKKSREAFDDAQLLAANRRWNSCVNRLYYSCFYLVSALLFQFDFKAETHNGTKTKFFLEFVKMTHISKENGKLYANLFDWRQESDYTDFIDFDEETILEIIKQVDVFLKDVEKVVLEKGR